jgi:hypothetical protein
MLDYQIVQESENEWFALVQIHGREFTYGPFETCHQAEQEIINRELDRVESWYAS